MAAPGGTRLVAIHTFAGEAEHDLPFKKGDVLFGERLDGSWWTGRDLQGKKGSFPVNYVREDAESGGAGVSAAAATAPSAPAAAMAKAPTGPSSRGAPAPAGVVGSGDRYGALPGGPPSPSLPGGPGRGGRGAGGEAAPGTITLEVSTEMTREGTVVVIRGLQFLTALLALSFMGAANSSASYEVLGVSITVSLSGGAKFVLAMAVIGWLWSIMIGGITFAIMKNSAPQFIVAHAKRHFLTFVIDTCIFALSLLAVTLCPTDAYSAMDGRVVAGAIFAALYMALLLVSMLMSYKDIVKEKLIAQGWQPPPGYDLTHGKNGTTPTASDAV